MAITKSMECIKNFVLELMLNFHKIKKLISEERAVSEYRARSPSARDGASERHSRSRSRSRSRSHSPPRSPFPVIKEEEGLVRRRMLVCRGKQIFSVVETDTDTDRYRINADFNPAHTEDVVAKTEWVNTSTVTPLTPDETTRVNLALYKFEIPVIKEEGH